MINNDIISECRSVTIEELGSHDGTVFIGGNFLLVDSLDCMPYIDEPFQTNNLLIAFCMHGHMQMTTDNKVREIAAGDILIIPPCNTISNVLHSSNCETWILGIATRAVDSFMAPEKDLFSIFDRAFFNPVLHYTEKYMNERITPFLHLLNQRASDIKLKYREKQIVHMFATIFFEVLNHANDHDEEALQQQYSRMSRGDELFKDFIQMMNADGGCHRTVAWYADKLCVTPKHLSKIIKEKSGQSALSILNEHAIQMIKIDLKTTGLPISTIADKYQFNNFSFFCQFVKQHLGLTPQNYRLTSSTSVP